jgi:uncharacterized membrane protein
VNGALAIIYLLGTAAVLSAGVAGMVQSAKRGWRVPRAVPYVIIAGTVYLLIAQILKLHADKDYADLTVWLQVISNIAHGKGPWSSLQDSFLPGSGDWLSTHFTPLMYVFAVPFRFFPRPETLLVAQFVALSTALVAIYLYARPRLGSEHALVIAAVLALYPTYQYVSLYEFEMLRFALPLLILAFLALEDGGLLAYSIWFGLALLVREEVAITTCLMGVYAAFFMPRRRAVGIATAVISATYFFVVLQVVMPALRTGGSTEYVQAQWFSQFGSTSLPRIALGVVTHPVTTLQVVAQPIKLANIFLYGLPVLFLPILALPVLLIGGGNIAVDMLSGSISHTSYFLYYQMPAIAFIFIALVKGVPRLATIIADRYASRGVPVEGVSVVLFGLVSAAMVSNVLFGPSPVSLQFWFKTYRVAPFRTENFHYTQYVASSHARLAPSVMAVIPTQATVSAEQSLLPLLYDRKALKTFPDIRGVQYVAIDKANPIKAGVATIPGSWDGLRDHPQTYYDWVEKAPADWTLVLAEDGYAVYRRTHAPR